MKALVSKRQYTILSRLVNTRDYILVDEIAYSIGIRREDLMRDLAELNNKGLVDIKREVVETYVLTDEGKKVLEIGLPEEIVYKVMFRCKSRSLDDFLECVSREGNISIEWARIGFQHLARNRCVNVVKGLVEVGSQDNCLKALEEATWTKAWLKEVAIGNKIPRDVERVLKRRRFIARTRLTKIYVKPSDKLLELWSRGLVREAEVVTIVHPRMYESGELENVIIKQFDLSIPPPRATISRLNPYMEFLDMVREILVSMGFEEVKGPHVELELWNFDTLFQAQDHPAREIHDTFFLDTDFLGRIEDQELVERARRVHEAKWGYKWSLEKALKPILRTQTTAVSARIIYERGPGEYRCFTIDRVFRPETLDAKHAMEFYQLDGIIVGKKVSFKDLLAFFKEFAAALGIKEVWFKPGYFPFTEPSVEGFVKHPKLGWIEVFPGGVFRPEVMEILGASEVRAIAWGIGIDRLAMTVLGIDDIRDLFTKDIDYIASMPEPRIPYYYTRTSAENVLVRKYPSR